MADSSFTNDFITQQRTNEKDHIESDENKENDAAVILQVNAIEAIDEFEDNSKVPHLSYWEIFVLFLNFGIHAWGGPVAEIAFIKERLVTKGQWISHARFNKVYSVYQILPGPEATELCMFFGFLAGRGRLGGFLGGLGFITPGFILMTLFSFIYVKIGLSNIYFNASFRALQPIVAAMVLRAVHKIGEHAFISSKTKRFNRWLFCFALLSAILSTLNLNFFITLAGCGIAFMFIDRKMYWLGLLVLALKIIGFGIYIGFKGVPSPTSIG
jgi:putative chromate ion transporter